jgi:tetratricopeptide (TPR) repeat protein
VRPTLSAAIIVRDEASYLRDCLASISDICDEIVVVDTGSTDGSVAVAESFGATIGVHPWNNDFAAARNAALDLATGVWILYIDADERIQPVDPALVRRELSEAADTIALRVWFRNRVGWSPYREFRVWRHRSDIRFVGRIHETMVPNIDRISRGEGLAIRHSETIRIDHLGYEGDLTAKHRRNLPMLEQRVTEHPTRCYLWNHLGNVRSQLGDPLGAINAWERGLNLVRTRGIVDRTDVLCFTSYGMHAIGRGQDVSDLVRELADLAPWYRTTDWMAAQNYAALHRPSEAVPHLRTLIATGDDTMDDSLTYNNAMFTTWAWELLAECLLSVDDIGGAAEVYQEASAFDPTNLEYRTKAVALRARAAR